MTLAIHLVWLAIWRGWITPIEMTASIFLQLLNAARWGLVLAWNLSARLVSDRRELNLGGTALLIVGRWLSAIGRVLSLGWVVLGRSSTRALLFGLAGVLLLLLASLPLLADLLEFYR
jgi:hypothetical protein